MNGNDFGVAGAPQDRLFSLRLPRPGIARPELGNDVENGFVAAAVGRHDFHQNVVGSGLGISDLDVEVAIVVEHSGVDQFELGIARSAAAVLLDQLRIGKLGLRIPV